MGVVIGTFETPQGYNVQLEQTPLVLHGGTCSTAAHGFVYARAFMSVG
jgi:hypothetical protein